MLVCGVDVVACDRWDSGRYLLMQKRRAGGARLGWELLVRFSLGLEDGFDGGDDAVDVRVGDASYVDAAGVDDVDAVLLA